MVSIGAVSIRRKFGRVSRTGTVFLDETLTAGDASGEMAFDALPNTFEFVGVASHEELVEPSIFLASSNSVICSGVNDFTKCSKGILFVELCESGELVKLFAFSDFF